MKKPSEKPVQKPAGKRGKVGPYGNAKVADSDSWTGRHIVSLVRLWGVEADAKASGTLLKSIEDAIEYLYRRGKDGRGRRSEDREPTESETQRVAAAATPPDDAACRPDEEADE